MKNLPIRLENAITKLYKAFHEGMLNALVCKACAVGNICDNNDTWSEAFTLVSDEKDINYNHPLANKLIKKSGYSHLELAIVEQLFVNGYNIITKKEIFKAPCVFDQNTKENQFNGLCAVIEYLCELDNIPNVTDYTKLFETENDKPKYQLL